MHVGKPTGGATKEKSDRVVPIQDAADYAGVHHSTIRRHLKTRGGTLNEYRKGVKLLYIDLDEVDELFTVRRAS